MHVLRRSLQAVVLLVASTALAVGGAGAASASLPGCTVDLVSSPVTVSVGVKATSPYGVFVCVDSAPGAPGAVEQTVRVDAVASPTFVGQSSAGVGTADYFVGYNTQPTFTVTPGTAGSVLTVSVPFTYQVGSFSETTPGGESGVIVGSIPLGGCAAGELCLGAGVPTVKLVADDREVPLFNTPLPAAAGLRLAGVLGAVEVSDEGSSCVLSICLVPDYVATNPSGQEAGTLYIGTLEQPVRVPSVCVYEASPGSCP